MAVIRLFFILFFILISCTPSTNTYQLASQSVVEQTILCSPFKKNGFEGVLTTNASNHLNGHSESTVFIIFENIPDEFKTDTNSFIQLRAVNYSNNKKQLSPSPLDIQYHDHRSSTVLQISNYIDHHKIRDSNLDINQFFSDYRFIIQDIAGWQSVFIGLFNEVETLVKSVQVLAPPFTVNPHTYREEHTDQRLFSLHPFYNLINAVDEDDINVFLSKAESACKGL